MGIWRKMKRNHSNQVARHLVFVHTAATQEQATDGSQARVERFRAGYAIFGRYSNNKLTRRKDLAFVEPANFWNVLHRSLSPRHTTWIFMHSAYRQLTNTDLWQQFENATLNLDAPRRKRDQEVDNKEHPFGFGYAVLSDPPFILGARHCQSRGRMIFVDSLNWFRTNLADLGEASGIDFFDRFDTGGDVADTVEHCRTGAVILENTFINLIRWIEENECGVMKYTAPMQSMAAYRHNRMAYDILPHDIPEAKELERGSYFGGQTEVYRPGPISERVYQVDVNSLYPFVMLNGLFPVKMVSWRVGKGDRMENIRGNLSASIARVEVEGVQHPYPVRHENKLSFVPGRDSYILAGPELVHLAEHATIKSYLDFTAYELAPIFTRFVNDFWALRQQYQREGNKLLDRFTKLILNSLYGKFAQRSPEWVPVLDAYSSDAFTQWVEINLTTGERNEFRSIGYNVQKQVERGEKDSSFIAISSFITSYARQHMRSMRDIAGRGNVFYQGVDSLIVNRAGYNRLTMTGQIHPTELGRLKLDGAYDDGYLHGSNDYELGTKVVRSGMKDSAIMLPDGSFRQDEWGGVPSLFNPGRNVVTITEKQKGRI